MPKSMGSTAAPLQRICWHAYTKMSIVFKFFDFALKFIKVLVWEGAIRAR